MKVSPTPFLSLLAKLTGVDLRPEQFSNDAANRLRRDQLRRTMEQMRIMLLCNTFFAPTLSFQAWNSGANAIILAWTGAILFFSWWLFFEWRKMYSTNGCARDMRRFVHQSFVNSSLWALGMALFYPIVEGDQKAIVTTIMAGSLALGTVGFSRAPSPAFVYLGVQTISNSSVAFLCGLFTGSSTDYLVALLSLGAGASVFSAVLERGKSSIVAFRDHEQLNEKSEVIDLLLKDYEEQATEWLWQTDLTGAITIAPAQILSMLDVTPGTESQHPLVDLLSYKITAESVDDIDRLKSAFENQHEFHDIRFSILNPEDGETRWILMKGRPQYVADEFRGFRGIFADATSSVTAERRVQFLAAYDSLTQLLNRNSVQKRLGDLQDGHLFAAAFLIDLDGFKQVNDSYGHDIGDSLLKGVAARLRDKQSADTFAARLGGDEFFVLMTSAEPIKKTTITYFADEIVDLLSQPFQAESFNIQMSTSVGIARFPENTKQGCELLSLADLALYKAKNSGRNRFEFFEADMQDVLNERIAITERLKTAVREKTIVPHYQSQHALSDGRLIGFEALARWYDDELGNVGPNVFIPIAEQTGLIVELGEQLLRKACADASNWAAVMPENPPVISVNFSPVQFARTDVVDVVSRILRETNLPPHLLEVEITEGVLISNKEKIATTLSELSARGVSIALDDFGTGYSSLSYLKDLPLDRLKIDRSFVRDIHDASPNPIVSSVIQLGHSLGLTVIAEGIEDQTQIDRLNQLGCDDGQGYYYSRPLSFDAASALLFDVAENTPCAKTV